MKKAGCKKKAARLIQMQSEEKKMPLENEKAIGYLLKDGGPTEKWKGRLESRKAD